jgi:hypothetical protein
MTEANDPHVSTTRMETFLLKPRYEDTRGTKCIYFVSIWCPFVIKMNSNDLMLHRQVNQK